ncbi:cytochrome c biogenesis protein [Nitratireductor aestuarii]|uniref:Cytochrome c-type biogenesis protein n=1 Tax=Nitratireductor aestuarii TaxID=1735103 RepID=A0A916RXH6_9HYPH|nr:cytochrome c-type biogenesis protein [Nitratireductor aestuarii]GGA75795.1 cytochrome c biogenesis protein [Nitratireductor aestuarii]
MRSILLALVLFCTMLGQAGAVVSPDEVLDDPALEARARALSANLRCMVCQNQSIDDSDAELARDLRVLVRERLVAGDTDEQVINYLTARYGEFVLLRPQFNSRNLILWGTPVLVLLVGGAFAFTAYRKRAGKRAIEQLSPEEEAALQKVLESKE